MNIAILALSVSVFSHTIVATKDPTMEPVSPPVFVNLIQKTPIASPENNELIAHAYTSGLAEEAYEQYTAIAQRHPNSTSATLYRGVAAEQYWQYATRPDVHQLSLLSPEAKLLFNTASSCLSAAAAKAPTLAVTNAAYGNFLFWYGGEMRQGVSMMKRAVMLQPSLEMGHSLLGNAYAEHSGDAYDLGKATNELTIAERLAPNNAFPPFRLVTVYLASGQYKEAEKQLKKYINLAPPSFAQSWPVKDWQSEIDKHLHD